ncbi:MAG: hypothetical protein K2F99_04590 [Muribaculaceae bacterium]|nr:hypothetical protein [Muribaculaceae bacterium]
MEVINRAKAEKAAGSKLILWTCREGHALWDAADYLKIEHGLTFDAINENIVEAEMLFGHTRKPVAHEYWDDRAIQMGDTEEERSGKNDLD